MTEKERNKESKISLDGFEKQVDTFIEDHSIDRANQIIKKMNEQDIHELLTAHPHPDEILKRLEQKLQSNDKMSYSLQYIYARLQRLVKSFQSHLSEEGDILTKIESTITPGKSEDSGEDVAPIDDEGLSASEVTEVLSSADGLHNHILSPLHDKSRIKYVFTRVSRKLEALYNLATGEQKTQLRQHLYHLADGGYSAIGYIYKQDFFDGLLDVSDTVMLQNMYTTVHDYWLQQSVELVKSPARRADAFTKLIKQRLPDSGEDPYIAESWQKIYRSLPDHEFDQSLFEHCFTGVFADHADADFDNQVVIDLALERYFDKKLTDDTGLYGVNQLDTHDPFSDMSKELDRSLRYQIANKTENRMRSRAEYLKNDEYYNSLSDKIDKAKQGYKRIFYQTQQQLLGVFLGGRRKRERRQKDVDDKDAEQLAEQAIFEKEYRTLFGSYNLDSKTDPLFSAYGLSSVALRTESDGQMSSIIHIVVGKNKIKTVHASIPDNNVHNTDMLLKQIIDPSRTDLSPDQKAHALWGFLKTWVRSVYDKYGAINGTWQQQSVMVGVPLGKLRIKLGDTWIFDEDKFAGLSVDQRLSQMLLVYRVFLSSLEDANTKLENQFSALSQSQVGLDAKAQRAVRAKFALDRRPLPEVIEAVDKTATGDSSEYKVAPLLYENFSLNYFVFPNQVQKPTEQRVVYSAGEIFIVEGPGATPRVIKKYATVSEWLSALPQAEQAEWLQKYASQFMTEYLKHGVGNKRKIYFSYYGDWYVARFQDTQLQIRQIKQPKDALIAYADPNKIPKLARSPKISQQPHFGRGKKGQMIGYQHFSAPITVLSVDDGYTKKVKNKDIFQSYYNPLFVDSLDTGSILQERPMFADLQFVDTFISTCQMTLHHT